MFDKKKKKMGFHVIQGNIWLKNKHGESELILVQEVANAKGLASHTRL